MAVSILFENSLSAPSRLKMLCIDWKFIIFLSFEGLCSHWTYILFMDIVIMTRVSDFGFQCVVSKTWHFRSPWSACFKCIFLLSLTPVSWVEAEAQAHPRSGSTDNPLPWHCGWRSNGRQYRFTRGACWRLPSFTVAKQVSWLSNLSLCTCIRLSWVYVCQVAGSPLCWTNQPN